MKIILTLTLLLLSIDTLQAEHSQGCKSCSVHKHVHPEMQCSHCHKFHRRKPRNPFKIYETPSDAGCADYTEQGFKREEKDGVIYVSYP